MFDPAHIHAIIVHLPIMGVFLAFIPLLLGLWRKNSSIQFTGLLLLVVSLCSLPLLMQSGEGAMEGFYTGSITPGLDEAGLYIASLHSQAAEIVAKIGYVVLILVIVQLILWKKSFRYKQKTLILTLILNVILFLGFVYVGYLGGQIRHTEFRPHISGEVGVVAE